MTREAAADGAQFVLTPEYTLMMDGSGRTMRERALDRGRRARARRASGARARALGVAARGLAHAARPTASASRTARTSSPRTATSSRRYDKIHMFDCDAARRQSDPRVVGVLSRRRAPSSPIRRGASSGSRCATTCAFRSSIARSRKAGARYLTIPSSFQRATGKVALAHALEGARDRERVLRLRARHVRRASRQPHDVRSLARRRSVGRSARRRRRSAGHRLRGHRSGARRATCAACCRASSTTGSSCRAHSRLDRRTRPALRRHRRHQHCPCA